MGNSLSSVSAPISPIKRSAPIYPSPRSPQLARINFLSEWCSSGADMKKLRMGCTKAYCSFGALIEASLMRRYHFQITFCEPMYIAKSQ